MELIQRRRQLMGMIGVSAEGMKLVKTFIVPDSWEDLTYGNTEYAYNTILRDVVEAGPSTAYNTYVAVYENNNASQTTYKADYMVATGIGGTGGIVYFQNIRNNRTVYGTTRVNTRQFYASKGTVVKVYALY